MKIRYKTIIEERSEDAPFVGALISAIDCTFNCENCFNQDLKHTRTKTAECEDIMARIKKNPFNKGIILAGLEWSNQPEEAKELINCAINNELKVMLYTGMDIDEFQKLFPELMIKDIYIKYGQYNESQRTINHIECGVILASANQHIIKI